VLQLDGLNLRCTLLQKASIFSRIAIAAIFALFPLLSALSIMYHKQYMHKKIEVQWESVLLEKLDLKKSDFPDLLKRKEIDFKGNRYDLVKVTDNGDSWLVSAINDTKEKWLESNMNASGNGQKFTSCWIFTVMLALPLELKTPAMNAVILKQRSIAEIIAIHILPIAPPPEPFCVS
jgi:hypothetical protein